MNTSRDSLDVLLQEYAYKSLAQHRTGILYNVTLPSNFSGIEVSALTLRSGSFWTKGANISEFRLPSRIIPQPFVKRMSVVYQNLGNWSSTYYNVPGYTMVTPVIGFMVYNATNVSAYSIMKLNLTLMGEPISVHFPQFILPQGSNSTSIKCVRFGEGASLEFSDMALNNVCSTRDQGHFSVVVPEVEKQKAKRSKERLWKWLVIGFALGFAALVLIGLVGVIVYKFVKMKRNEEMERKADEGESFENVWIGMSRMPSATVTRTQPVLEHNEVP
ncbi:hypothetical protein IFM89_038527 [Coptis chinensis]|uniref:Uncharacterized protein n=1 Tax=Coptis chinensis TaxID=261450 RepID=A0A835IF15_9MAGN|nr:hypothetical protein IFM89_038527 [Coptis chinensis]